MAILTDIEYTSRKNHRLDRLIKNSNFDQPRAHIAEIDFSPRRELNRDQIVRLASCEFISDSRNVIIMGAARLRQILHRLRAGHGSLQAVLHRQIRPLAVVT